MPVKKSKKRFRFNGGIIVLYLALMGLLISLGNWQIRRAEYKQQLLDAQKAALTRPALNLNHIQQPTLADLLNRKVRVQGVYDSQHQFLIDNQMHQGKVGYYVLTPLKIKGKNKAVLVNRGWVAMNPDRRVLPDIAVSTNQITLSGRVNHFPRVGYQLEGADKPTEGWPAVVQVVNPAILSQRLGYPILDFQIELDDEQPEGFIREWAIKQKMPPEKHYAYAAQWFGLAATLTVLMLWMGFKKTDE